MVVKATPREKEGLRKALQLMVWRERVRLVKSLWKRLVKRSTGVLG